MSRLATKEYIHNIAYNIVPSFSARNKDQKLVGQFFGNGYF